MHSVIHITCIHCSVGDYGICVTNETLNGDEELIATCRPGGRVWLVDTDGTVQSTVMLSSYILSAPTLIAPNMRLVDNIVLVCNYCRQGTTVDDTSRTNELGRLLCRTDGVIISWSALVIYIIDIVNVRVLLCIRPPDRLAFMDVRLCDNEYWILLNDGCILRLGNTPPDQYLVTQQLRNKTLWNTNGWKYLKRMSIIVCLDIFQTTKRFLSNAISNIPPIGIEQSFEHNENDDNAGVI
jgi:hypothetical protein